MSSDLYASICFRKSDIPRIAQVVNNFEEWYIDGADDSEEFEENGVQMLRISDNYMHNVIEALEKADYPVPVTGFTETEELHTSYCFVCPGDGTYHEVQVDDFHRPVVAVTFDGEHVVPLPESEAQAVEYFKAMARYEEEVKK